MLLIKRNRGDYVGLWGLPGGKVEKNEHLKNAAQREIKEETGIDTEFIKFNGIISEHLTENNQVLKHFLLHVCTLKTLSNEFEIKGEGELRWFELDKLKEDNEKIIPSDFCIIESMIKKSDKNYFNCIIEKKLDEHILRLFE